MRAIITFMCSSGTGRRECLNLQVQQYLNGFKDYINTPVTTENIQLIINEINKLIDDELIIIPKIDLIRQKQEDTTSHFAAQKQYEVSILTY